MTKQNIEDARKYIEMIDWEIFPKRRGRVFIIPARSMSRRDALAQYHRRKVGAFPAIAATIILTLGMLAALIVLGTKQAFYSIKLSKRRDVVRSYERTMRYFRIIYTIWFPSYAVSQKRLKKYSTIYLIGLALHEVRHRVQDADCFTKNCKPEAAEGFQRYQKAEETAPRRKYRDSKEMLREIDAMWVQEVIKSIAYEDFTSDSPSDEEVRMFIKKYAKRLLLTRYTQPSEKFF